jgi:hypothetical protein
MTEDQRFAAAKPAIVHEANSFLPEIRTATPVETAAAPATATPANVVGEAKPEAPANPPQPETGKAPTWHQKLDLFLGENEISNADFLKWGGENGHFNPGLSKLEEIPATRVKLLIGTPEAQRAVLAALKGGAQ